jgi:hypothetical protein
MPAVIKNLTIQWKPWRLLTWAFAYQLKSKFTDRLAFCFNLPYSLTSKNACDLEVDYGERINHENVI